MNNHALQPVSPQLSEVKGTNLAHEIFTSNFWITGLAILKYIPRSFRVPQVEGMAFFSTDKREEFRNRVLGITPNNKGRWGTMCVAQMLHHLNLACGSPLRFYTLPDESYLVARTLFRWVLIDWYPEQPIGLRLPKGFKIPHNAQFDFDFDKKQLLTILAAAGNAKSGTDWGPHPMFGKMTVREWGKLFEIHVDYHLRQFAA
jgi:hypothetical protein